MNLWQFSWYRTTILLLPAGGNWANGRSKPLRAARKSSKLRENDALGIFCLSRNCWQLLRMCNCENVRCWYQWKMVRSGFSAWCTTVAQCAEIVRYYSWCTDAQWRGCNCWCTTDETHLLAKPKTFLLNFPCCSSLYHSMSIRACCREANFSKSLAWVFFWCLFMIRIGNKNPRDHIWQLFEL